jgi:hypothetical protein
MFKQMPHAVNHLFAPVWALRGGRTIKLTPWSRTFSPLSPSRRLPVRIVKETSSITSFLLFFCRQPPGCAPRRAPPPGAKSSVRREVCPGTAPAEHRHEAASAAHHGRQNNTACWLRGSMRSNTACLRRVPQSSRARTQARERRQSMYPSQYKWDGSAAAAAARLRRISRMVSLLHFAHSVDALEEKGPWTI